MEVMSRDIMQMLSELFMREKMSFNNIFELSMDIISRDWNLRADQIRLEINIFNINSNQSLE